MPPFASARRRRFGTSSYIQRETARVEVNLGDLLAQVKAYRKADPDFGHAHARVVEAEVKAAGNDPADGTPYTEAPATTRRRSHTWTGTRWDKDSYGTTSIVSRADSSTRLFSVQDRH